MAKMTRAARSAAAQKGARTKARQANLSNALQIKSYLDKGLSVHEIALLTGDPIKAILDALKLLTLAPNPILKGVGSAATITDAARTINDALKTNATTRQNATNIVASHAPKEIQPLLNRIIANPAGAHNAVVEGLNNLGRSVTQPFTDLNNFLGALFTGDPTRPFV